MVRQGANVEMFKRVPVPGKAIDPEDPAMLEDLILAAFNEAVRKMDDTLRHKVGSMASGLPNLF